MHVYDQMNIGATGEAQVDVNLELTVKHMDARLPAVYATPNMISLMEFAALNAVQEDLPENWVTVGVGVNITHLKATPVGRTVTAHAKLVKKDDKLLHFEVSAHDGTNLIGKGTHSRAAIDLVRFEKSLQGN